jgi:hypothetical protein
MSHSLSIIAAIISLLGAGIGMRAATVEVRDDIDAFIGDIKRQSQWSCRAAVAGCAAAFLNAVLSFWL